MPSRLPEPPSGATRDEAIAAARAEYGSDVRIRGVRRIRSGGVAGFFSSERYVADVVLPDDDAVAPRSGATRSAAPGSAGVPTAGSRPTPAGLASAGMTSSSPVPGGRASAGRAAAGEAPTTGAPAAAVVSKAEALAQWPASGLSVDDLLEVALQVRGAQRITDETPTGVLPAVDPVAELEDLLGSGSAEVQVYSPTSLARPASPAPRAGQPAPARARATGLAVAEVAVHAVEPTGPTAGRRPLATRRAPDPVEPAAPAWERTSRADLPAVATVEPTDGEDGTPPSPFAAALMRVVTGDDEVQAAVAGAAEDEEQRLAAELDTESTTEPELSGGPADRVAAVRQAAARAEAEAIAAARVEMARLEAARRGGSAGRADRPAIAPAPVDPPEQAVGAPTRGRPPVDPRSAERREAAQARAAARRAARAEAVRADAVRLEAERVAAEAAEMAEMAEMATGAAAMAEVAAPPTPEDVGMGPAAPVDATSRIALGPRPGMPAAAQRPPARRTPVGTATPVATTRVTSARAGAAQLRAAAIRAAGELAERQVAEFHAPDLLDEFVDAELAGAAQQSAAAPLADRAARLRSVLAAATPQAEPASASRPAAVDEDGAPSRPAADGSTPASARRALPAVPPRAADRAARPKSGEVQDTTARVGDAADLAHPAEAAREEAARVQAQRAEAEHVAAEQAAAETARLAQAERAAALRAAAERAEAERIAAEEAAAARAEAQRRAAEEAAAARAEARRIAAEETAAAEAARRAEAERVAALRAMAERADAERIAAEEAAARAEAQRIAAQRAEAQRIAAEEAAAAEAARRAEAERAAALRAMAERADAERIAAEKAAAAEAERIAVQQAEAERRVAEQAQRAETDRRAAEQAQRAETDRLAAEAAAAERAEARRIAAEEAAAAEAARRAEAERLVAQRIAAEQAAAAEAERIAAQQADAQRASRPVVAVETERRTRAQRREAAELARAASLETRVAADLPEVAEIDPLWGTPVRRPVAVEDDGRHRGGQVDVPAEAVPAPHVELVVLAGALEPVAENDGPEPVVGVVLDERGAVFPTGSRYDEVLFGSSRATGVLTGLPREGRSAPREALGEALRATLAGVGSASWRSGEPTGRHRTMPTQVDLPVVGAARLAALEDPAEATSGFIESLQAVADSDFAAVPPAAYGTSDLAAEVSGLLVQEMAHEMAAGMAEELARTASDPAPPMMDATTVLPSLDALVPAATPRVRGARPPVPPTQLGRSRAIPPHPTTRSRGARTEDGDGWATITHLVPVTDDPATPDGGPAGLAALGVPASVLGADFAAEAGRRGTFAALAAALGRALPAAPAIPSEPGNVLVVVGPGAEALTAARGLAVALRLDPARVQWATRGALAGLASADVQVSGAGVAAARRTAAADADVPTVVAIDVPLGDAGGAWAAQMLQAWAPTAVWGVLDSTRKAGALRGWLAGLPRVDAVIVTDTESAPDPAALLDRLPVPVAVVDGARATPHRWAALLCERLAGRS